MVWWITPLVVGVLAVPAGIVWPSVGWLGWLGLDLVVLAIVIAIFHPGSRKEPRAPRKAAAPQAPYFS